MWGNARLVVLSFGVCASLSCDVIAQSDRPSGVQQRFELPSFIGGQSLKELEQARSALESETKRKSDEAKLVNEAEARRRAEEERRAAAEAEVKRKAEEVRRLSAIEAEAKRRLGDERRLMEQENEAKKRADERFRALMTSPSQEAPVTPAAAPPAPPAGPQEPQPAQAATAAAAAGALSVPPASLACPPASITSEPMSGGRMRIEVTSACRAGQQVTIAYGPVNLVRSLDSAGRGSIVLDLFLGTTTPLRAGFADGSRRDIDIRTQDLASVSKIAVVWRPEVNLDLHAYEFTARDNDPGHVWAGASQPAEAARESAQKWGRGHGFLGMVSDAATPGDKVEVYTLWHAGEARGVVTMALDYETRGDVPKGQNCGSGGLASIAVTVWRLPRGAATALSEERVLAAVPCDAPLARELRFNPDSMPHLSIK